MRRLRAHRCSWVAQNNKRYQYYHWYGGCAAKRCTAVAMAACLAASLTQSGGWRYDDSDSPALPAALRAHPTYVLNPLHPSNPLNYAEVDF